MTLPGSPQTCPLSGRVESRYSSCAEGALGDKGTKDSDRGTKDSDKLCYSSCPHINTGIPKEPRAQGMTARALRASGWLMR